MNSDRTRVGCNDETRAWTVALDASGHIARRANDAAGLSIDPGILGAIRDNVALLRKVPVPQAGCAACIAGLAAVGIVARLEMHPRAQRMIVVDGKVELDIEFVDEPVHVD